MRRQFRSVLKYSLVGLALASFASVAQSPLDVRVALVIGNAAYKHVPALVNSGNDAKSMAFVLGRLGFKVVEVIDGDRASMSRAIEQMQGQLKGQQAVAMLYYAGHGLQLDWRNYMVPVDAQLGKADDVPKQTVDVEQVIRVFKGAGTRMNIVVLDACRDNPFSSATGSKGLAQLDAPAGTYLAFATAPGNVAEDGDEASGNGLFTQFLLKELQRPASIESVFKRVRLQVRQKSQGRQVPWDSSSLEDEFAFNDGKKYTFTMEDYQREVQAAKEKEERLKREAEAALARERQLAQQREQERLKLAEAQKIQEEQARLKAEAEARERERKLALAAEEERKKALAAQQALERARQEEAQRLKDIELAKAQAEEEERLKKMSAERQFEIQKAEWDKIKDSKNPDDFYAFLQRHPNSSVSKAAEVRLAMLAESSLRASPGKNGIVATVKPTERFQLGDVYHWVSKHPDTGQVYQRGADTVVKISDYSVELSNGEVFSRNGAIQVIRMGKKLYNLEPPQVFFPPEDFKVGDGWRTESLIDYGFLKFKTSGEIKILGKENITVEAGTYETYKIRVKGGNIREQMEMISWVHPDFGRAVKILWKSTTGAYWSWEWAKHPRQKPS